MTQDGQSNTTVVKPLWLGLLLFAVCTVGMVVSILLHSTPGYLASWVAGWVMVWKGPYR